MHTQGGIRVTFHDAQQYVGKECLIHWRDRAGNELQVRSQIYEATYVPLYGGVLVTDGDDIRLDRVSHIAPAGEVFDPIPQAA